MVRIGITVAGHDKLHWYRHYFDRIREQGAEPLAIDPSARPEAIIQEIDGLLLPGGADVSPGYYGEAAHPTVCSRPDLDALEIPLTRLALERDLPILAICRGHQLLNVVCGGRLLQHIEGDRHDSYSSPQGEVSRWHRVRIDPNSRLAHLISQTELEVNSRHHQAVLPPMVAPGLIATAWSPDGLVEGLERPASRFVLSVQWHPERPEPKPHFTPAFVPLFKSFVEAASGVPGRTRTDEQPAHRD